MLIFGSCVGWDAGFVKGYRQIGCPRMGPLPLNSLLQYFYLRRRLRDCSTSASPRRQQSALQKLIRTSAPAAVGKSELFKSDSFRSWNLIIHGIATGVPLFQPWTVAETRRRLSAAASPAGWNKVVTMTAAE